MHFLPYFNTKQESLPASSIIPGWDVPRVLPQPLPSSRPPGSAPHTPIAHCSASARAALPSGRFSEEISMRTRSRSTVEAKKATISGNELTCEKCHSAFLACLGLEIIRKATSGNVTQPTDDSSPGQAPTDNSNAVWLCEWKTLSPFSTFPQTPEENLHRKL